MPYPGFLLHLNRMNSPSSKRVVRAWCMYDWANSVYNLVISSAIFPVYYTAITTTKDDQGNPISDVVHFMGMDLKNTVLSNFVIAFSLLLVCVLSPMFSGLADAKGNKKTFLRLYCYMGAIACMGLFFFTNRFDTLWVGVLCIFFASLGFWNSLVFYNAFLPEIAPPEETDRISARGFAMGYLGSSLLLIICLVFIQGLAKPLGLETGTATRLCFVMVGIWWIGFAQYLFNRVPEKRKDGPSSITKGFKELGGVWKQVKSDPSIGRYLTAFFSYSMGVQTVMLVAAYFGSKLLQLPAGKLIPTILLIQFVGIAGSFLFSWLSDKWGNKPALQLAIFIWISICVGAWFVAEYKSETGFYILAFLVGLVMGGIQSQSRATYAKLIPEGATDTASFFSFYDITEKLSMVLGLGLFAYVEQVSVKGMQTSVLALIAFFSLGFLFLLRLRDPRLKPSL